jgi:cyclic pyranopterin phosphate synthase
MPADGLTFVRRSELLTYEEIERLAQLAVERLGVDAVRLTGGEPTVRADLSELVCQLARLRTWQGDPVDLSLTTNGTTLRRQAASLRAAGLRRVNVSLDSLRPERLPRSRGGTTSTRCWTESMRRWRWVSRQ